MRLDASEGGLEAAVDDSKLFTDREDLLSLFSGHLGASRSQTSRVLMFYGVGGIGKTALIRKLAREMQEQEPRMPQARFDLHDVTEAIQANRRVLLGLRLELEKRYRINFRRFDLCLAVLMAREGGASTPLAPLPPALSTTLQFVLALAGALQAVPLPALPAMYKFAGDLVGAVLKKSPKLKEWVRWAGGTEEVTTLLARALQDEDGLTRELSRRFVQDIQSASPFTGQDRLYSCVLFLDNYQGLWKNGEEEHSVHGRETDRWVRELAEWCLGSGVLLVLSGRERLLWPQSEWSDCLEQQRLLGLAGRDAQWMLFRRGVGASPEGGPPSPLQESIIRRCGAAVETTPDAQEYPTDCHPQFLALCCDIVHNSIRVDGCEPSPELFAGMPNLQTAGELAALFLRTLRNRSMESWITELSVTPRFDHAAALALDRERHHNNGRAGWKLLLGFSFVEALPGGFYRLHRTMQDALRFTISSDDAQQVHPFFERHWKTRPQRQLSLSWFHRWFPNPQETLNDWTEQYEAALQKAEMAYCRWMVSLWDDVPLNEAGRDHMGEVLWAETHLTLADSFCRTYMVPRAQAYLVGMAHYRAALSVLTREKTPRAWARLQNNLGNVYTMMPFGETLENACSALACFEAAQEVYTRESHPQDWAMLQSNIGKTYLHMPTGDPTLDREHVQKALGHIEASMQFCDKERDPSDWGMRHLNLAAAHLQFPSDGAPSDKEARVKKAISLLRVSLQVLKRETFPHEWAVVQANLGAAYAMLPPNERAKNVRRSIVRYEAALRVHNPRDFPEPWANIQVGLGGVYSRLWGTADNILSLHASARCYDNATIGYQALGQDIKAQQQMTAALQASRQLQGLELNYEEVSGILREAGFDPLRSAVKIERMGDQHLLAVHHHREFYPACQRRHLGSAMLFVLKGAVSRLVTL